MCMYYYISFMSIESRTQKSAYTFCGRKCMRAWSQNKSLIYFSVSSGPGGNAICDACGGALTLSAHVNTFFFTSRPGLNRFGYDRNALEISSFTSLLIIFFNLKIKRNKKLKIPLIENDFLCTNLWRQLKSMPVIFNIRINYIRQIVIATRIVQRQIEQHQVHHIFDIHMQSSQKLNAMIAIRTRKEIKSATINLV